MNAFVTPIGTVKRIAAGLCLTALSTIASATVLTFDDLRSGYAYYSPTSTLSESGYTFSYSGTDGGPAYWHLGDGTFVDQTLNWHGTPGGFNSNLTLTLTKDDGGLFDLLELDIDILTGASGAGIFAVSAPGYAERTFGVTLGEPGLVSLDDQSLDFLGVSEVVFRHVRGDGVGIDNVLVNAHQAPEPMAVSLLVIGAAGLAFRQRRKQRLAALSGS